MSGAKGYTVPTPAWFQEMADSFCGVVFFVLRTRPELAFEFVNAGNDTELVGYAPDTTREDAAHLFSHLMPDSRTDMDRLIALEPGSSIALEASWRHVSGRITRSVIRAKARAREDGSVIVEGAMQDITELHATQTSLERSEERHRLLAEHTAAIVWSMDPDGTVTYVSAAVEPLRGFSPAEALRHRTDDVFLPESAAAIRNYIGEMKAALARGQTPKPLDTEVQCYRRDGSVMLGAMSVIPHLDSTGTLVEMVGIIQDISDQRALEAELRRMATTDPLTGVANRRRGEDALNASGARQEIGHALLMIDLDHFKEINDTEGHEAGDRALIEVARGINGAVRAGDVVARWGGDEFLVLLHDCAPADAVDVAAAVRSRLEGSGISVSIGVAALNAETDWSESVKRADDALFQAKRSGRGGISV